MKKGLLWFLMLFIPVLATPWLFTGSSNVQVLGFPLWGFLALVITVFYALFIAWSLHAYWDGLTGEDDLGNTENSSCTDVSQSSNLDRREDA